MGKHTPGPWVVRTRATTAAGIGTDVVAVDIMHNGRRIGAATVRDQSAEANGHLMAAAPDLLTALRSIADMIGDAVDHKVHTGRMPSIAPLLSTIEDTARAAIAKAEGREP